jgi:hypothetical protein
METTTRSCLAASRQLRHRSPPLDIDDQGDGKRLPGPDVVGLGHRVAYNLPPQAMTNLPKLGGFVVPDRCDVQRTERYDKIFAVAIDRHLSPKRPEL